MTAADGPRGSSTGVVPRGVALAVLRRVERDHAYADVALNAALAESTLDARDRALAARLVYGTLAWQGRLDWHLARLAARPVDALDPELRSILRLGLYQLLLLDRIPAHAAVATSVELAKGAAPAAAGLVNAVLRRAAREGKALPLPDAANTVRHLAVAYSHPEWLVARWLDAFGPNETRRLLAADNEAAPTVVRARLGGRDRLLADFAAQGVDATPARYAPDAVVVDSAAPQLLAGHARGDFVVQSEASQLVARLLDPPPGTRVLDACAAPGGKATYLAELAGDGGLVLACDVRPRRASTIAAVARRLGIARLTLGTLRAHPEVRWSRTPADVHRLAALQAEILDAVTPHLAHGGALVYATCTISPEENEQVVDRWLARHPELERENAAKLLPPAAAAFVDADGALRTLPHRDGLDGFYAVRVRRRT
ncbi:MAG: 16S rRNA (cytosine(967)-C(5))-methyltransferase RsmB [Deltaproteobacteria bacterium]|nr:MAG: 16S rRNA (cytosine(967)-C(5))-methyltransferase RsmB [Deltaproteobacteria bacterium]